MEPKRSRSKEELDREPKTEKSTMTEPQEEFIQPESVPSHVKLPPRPESLEKEEQKEHGDKPASKE